MCPSRSSSLGLCRESVVALRAGERSVTFAPAKPTEDETDASPSSPAAPLPRLLDTVAPVQPMAEETDASKSFITRALKRRGSIREKMRSQVFERLNSGDVLDRLEAGQTGGVYTVPDECPSDSKVDTPPMAVFKSEGEEGFARRGILPGCGAVREEAAYLLDRLVGSAAGVPVTLRTAVPVAVLRRKMEDVAQTCNGEHRSPTDESGGLVHGAVQSFVADVVGAAEDFGMPRDLASADRVVSTAAAQQIASLDIRLCNTDRHAGNLLFQCGGNGEDGHPSMVNSAYKPVPIDHGCTLPRWWAMGEANFEAWAYWPQVRAPCLPEVLDAVEAAFREREQAVLTLAELGLEPAAQATYYIAVSLLHAGTVRHGLSLACVASLLSRNAINPGEPSWLEEKMVEIAAGLGIDLEWMEDSYGDRVPKAPEDEDAWPPEALLEGLLELFDSEETRLAGLENAEG